MRITDKYVFFYRSKLGQWSIAPMIVNGITYNCCEQYMMHQKALLFGDYEVAGQIMATESPKEQKALGRKVKNFDVSVWNTNAQRIVFEGNLAKFSQHKEHRDILMSYPGKEFVEASPVDRIWGIGLDENDLSADDPLNWNGLNWLGDVLTSVRDHLQPGYDYAKELGY